MDIKVYNLDGTETSEVLQLNPDIFGIEPNEHAIYLDVKQYLANKRQGTAKTKERSELSGSTRKLFRQKGTGGARRGDINSPLLRGGARVFGPRVRDYSLKVNKKVKLLARKSALSYKAANNCITICESINFEKPKTKQFVEILKNFKYLDQKILLVLESNKKEVILSVRNLRNVKLLSPYDLNTYEILWANKLLIEKEALKKIEENLLKQ